MEVNLTGRVNNLSLATSNALMPLFEAVVNSIQGIEDSKNKKSGKIDLHLIRGDESQTKLSLGEKETRPLTGFKIRDNGIGFDSNNFSSFETSDSLWKKERGGKGIGRLFWLKAFNSVTVSSVYEENGERSKRTFDFILPSGVANKKVSKVPISDKIETTVELIGFKESYRTASNKRAESIGRKIVEHCLSYFLGTDCPEIILTDDDEDLSINLNDWFHENMGDSIFRDTITVKKEVFEIVGLPLFAGGENTSQLHWCSSNREVRSESLSHVVPNLKGKLKDESRNRNYVFVAYLSGPYLDQNTNAERTDFNIPETDIDKEEAALDLEHPPSRAEIKRELGLYLSDKLKEKLEPIAKAKKEQLDRYVAEEAPQYRPLIQFSPEILDSIPPGLPDEKLDAELHKAQYALEAKLKKESKVLVEKVSNPSISEEDKQNLEKTFFEKISVVQHAHLAKYVLSRKMILDIYDSAIKQKADGSFDRESVIHNLVFPRYKTSNTVSHESYNLWLLDERLAYHQYLGSDKEIQNLEGVESANRDRPDIIVFNNPSVFSEGVMPYSSAVVVEFKKPGREGAGKEDNDPIQQMLNYITDIREGKKRGSDGQQILVPEKIPFFAYLVCDLTEDVTRMALDWDLQRTSDGGGFFGYHNNHGTYIEVISFKKVGADARKRNRMFFEKLGIG